MSEPQAAPRKPSFWQTLRGSVGPYKRLFSYVKPYKWRFVLGLVFGFGFGVITGAMPLVLAKVMGAVFQGGGVSPQQIAQNPALRQALGAAARQDVAPFTYAAWVAGMRRALAAVGADLANGNC